MPAPRRRIGRRDVPQTATPSATSRRTARSGASPRSAPRADPARAGSSFLPMFGQKGRQIDRMPLQLFKKDQQPVIGHPLWIEDPVEMVTLVLNDPGVEALD